MKIAYYFGSFDPIHNGHINVVKQAFDSGIEYVIFVLAMQNPMKGRVPTDMYERASLIYSVMFHVKTDKEYKVSFVESKPELKPPYYTYNTLQELDKEYKDDEKYIICGQDMYDEIPNWYKGNEILENYKFLVFERTNESSTEVRNLIKRLNELLPPNIAEKCLEYYGKNT